MNRTTVSLHTSLPGNDCSRSAWLDKPEEPTGMFGKSLLHNVWSVGESAKVLQQTSTRQASIALWEREMKLRKEHFGLDLYAIMERNRSMGRIGGGETDPNVIEVFQNCVADMAKFLMQRKSLQAELLRKSKPKTLSYQRCLDTVTPKAPETMEDSSTKSWFQRRMGQKLQQAKVAIENTHSTSRIRTQLTTIEKEMTERQKKFGIDMFEMMAYMVDNYTPHDPQIAKLLVETKKDISIPLAKTIQAEKEIHHVLTNGGLLISHADIHNFIAATPTCWAMLHVNTGIPEEECRLVAYRVSLELASGRRGEASLSAAITKKQFQKFQKEYIDDPKGNQEFFHRCVFAAFDEDSNGVLDLDEIDKFLDTFYVTGSIFQGDVRLPDKETLKNLILEQLDENGDGLFNFEEIRSLISGSAERGKLQQSR